MGYDVPIPTASPIQQREGSFVAEISFLNYCLPLSFRHASPYVLTCIFYSKAQAIPAPYSKLSTSGPVQLSGPTFTPGSDCPLPIATS